MNGKKPIIFRSISIGALIAAIVLEALPFGAVLIFMPSPNETLTQYYSYFDFTPFGYANFAPLITAILTVLLAAASIALTLVKFKARKLNSALLALNIITAIISVFPIFYGFDFYSVTGIIISLSLTASAIFFTLSIMTVNNTENVSKKELS